MQHNSSHQCYSSTTQSVTSTVTPKLSVTSNTNPVKKNILMGIDNKNGVYLSLQETVTLLNCSKMTLCRAIKSRKFTAKTVTGRGGKQYQILLSSLPESAQVKYWSERIQISEKVIDTLDVEIALNTYQSEPEYNRKKADKYSNLLQLCEGKTGSELETVIKIWNTKNPTLKSSYRSVMRMRSEYAKNGMDALIAKYGKTKNQNRSIDALGQIGSKAYDMFESIYLGEVGQGAPSVHSCWIQVYGFAKILWAETHNGDVTEFDEVFPIGETFLRAVERKVGESAIYLARHGLHAHNQKYANFVNRDYTNVKAGEVWVSDHRQLDQIWRDKDGSFKRPWLTAWVCFKTQKTLSWSIHFDAPRADHVIDTFVDAVEKWGVPAAIYIDNGKDYRSLDFAGGRRQIRIKFDELKTKSLLNILGVEVKFAQPYNAQTKIIERIFKIYKGWFDQHTHTYTGGNHVERPEILETYLKRNHNIPSFEEGSKLLKFFIENVLDTHTSEGKVLAGRSRGEAFMEEYNGLPRVSADSLGILRARNSNVRTIGANGIKESTLNDYYWADWVELNKGRKVYLRRSMSAMQNAWVFDAESDEFIGMAKLGMWNAPAFAKTDLEKQQLQEVLTRKKQTKKAQEQLAKVQDTPSLEERLKWAALHNTKLSDTPTPEQKNSNILLHTKYNDVLKQQEKQLRTGTDNVDIFSSDYNSEQSNSKTVYSIFEH